MRAGAGEGFAAAVSRRAGRPPAAVVAVVLLLAGAALTLALQARGPSPPLHRLRAKAGSDTPAGVVLAFWHELGAGHYAGAYATLDRAARAEIDYDRFVHAARRAAAAFDRTPDSVRTAAVGGGLVRVSVASARDGVQRSDSPIVLFEVRRIGREWRIAGGAGI